MYRSKKCWTNESDLVGGERIGEENLKATIHRHSDSVNVNAPLLVAEWTFEKEEAGASERPVLLGCIQAERCGVEGYLGLFAVHHGYQSQGIGTFLMKAAIQYCQLIWSCPTVIVYVIAAREDIRLWYERMGFCNSKQREEFPPEFKPFSKIDDIHFLVYRKTLM